MKIQGVKGTRDLYPEVLAPIRHIFDVWRRVARRHGFDEWDGPTLESLDLYREKSGEELVGQLYRLTDSGGRELALRPEMTPTLARMIASRVHAMPKPIKWFCISNLFRGENVQRGRLREFFQWNVDVIGSDLMAADAEVILVGVEALRELGLTQKDFAVHISNRRLMGAVLGDCGIDPAVHAAAFALLDKAARVDRAELSRRWNPAHGTHLPFEALEGLLNAGSVSELRAAVASHVRAKGRLSAELEEAARETEELFSILDNFGILEFCKFDMHVVRGLAYYTGPVFEFYDRAQTERAICGGGRYDDLLAKLGKSSEPAVGFGMGDVVLSLMLEERGLLRVPRRGGDVMVVDATDGLRPTLHRVVAALRRAGVRADFSYTVQGLAKQLKAADKSGARFVIVLGEETREREVVRIKEMKSGEEREVPLQSLLTDSAAYVVQGS
jgi:histidyl-tRNA synthetase